MGRMFESYSYFYTVHQRKKYIQQENDHNSTHYIVNKAIQTNHHQNVSLKRAEFSKCTGHKEHALGD